MVFVCISRSRKRMMKLLVPLMFAVAVASQQQQQQQQWEWKEQQEEQREEEQREWEWEEEQQEATVEVKLEQGFILGFLQETGRGRPFYSFKGVPYAQPPVGELRFKDPVPAGRWPGVRDGSTIAPPCPQLSLESFLENKMEMEGSEDCLYLNVFTAARHWPYTSGLPVMVFIHGGGFVEGSMDMYGPQLLLNKDVVVVVIQYRLGVLGFLSTEDSVLPGNLGLKDQTLALRWVQENIRNLGGDPAKVTIFGESAGAASVHYHLLSPHSSGLFSRAILQSGTALCPWALREDHRQVAFRIGDHLNCSGAAKSSFTKMDSNQLLACLNQVPLRDLVLSPSSLYVWGRMPNYMTPRVDGDFLPDHPAKLLRSDRFNKVDMMAGITRNEGIASVLYLYSPLSDDALAILNENFTLAGPVAMAFEDTEERPLYLTQRAFYYYLGGVQIKEDLVDGADALFSDRFFKSCHEDSAHFHAPSSLLGKKLFLYQLEHRGQQSLTDIFNMSTAGDYVSHGDDLMYLFNGILLFKPLTSPADLFVSDIMVDLWTNFADTGNPTPKGSLGFRWTSAKKDDLKYLSLTTTPAMRSDMNYQDREFWRNMPTKQNKMLFPERFTEWQSPSLKLPLPAYPHSAHCGNHPH